MTTIACNNRYGYCLSYRSNARKHSFNVFRFIGKFLKSHSALLTYCHAAVLMVSIPFFFWLDALGLSAVELLVVAKIETLVISIPLHALTMYLSHKK